MTKSEILKNISIGSRVAELELEGLKQYFLKTYLWEQILKGDIDIVFGSKGSGKSAIYSYMSTLEYEFMGEDVLLAPAENPRGAVAFRDLYINPPADEFEFKSIWKLYFAIIVFQKLQDFNYSDVNFVEVRDKLQDSDLISRSFTFSSLVKLVRGYFGKVIPSIEPNVGISEYTGLIERIGVKISFSEPSTKQADKGIVSVDQIFELLNTSLGKKGEKLWITIDRLDAIFQDNFELEAKALRTLFQVYIDLMAFTNIRLIIFLRDDIWNRIIEGGFRETSHIIKTDTIIWDKKSLSQLLMSRLEQNKFLFEYLKIVDDKSQESQQIIFHKLFPKKNLENFEFNFDWILTRIKDSNGNAAPRELIQIVSAAIKHQIKLCELHESEDDTNLLSIQAMIEGFKEVSKTKLDTLVAEYPKLKTFIYRLKGKKVKLNMDELKEFWDCSKKDAKLIANNLEKVGFFKNVSEDNNNPIFFVPLIYRSSLAMQC